MDFSAAKAKLKRPRGRMGRVMRRALEALRDGDWLTSRRMKRWALPFALAWSVLLAFDVSQHLRPGLVDARGEPLGRDFVNWWAAPRLIEEGNVADVWSPTRLTAFERDLTAPNAEAKFYSYPPPGLLLTWPLSRLPHLVAWAVWTFGGLGVLAAMLARPLGSRWAVIAVLATPAVFLNARVGQNGAVTAALMAGALSLVDRRPVVAGAMLGLFVVKPQLALLAPVALIAGRRWRALAAAGATAAALVLASGLALGWGAWAAYRNALPIQFGLMALQTDIWRSMPTVFAAARQLGLAPAAAWVLQAGSTGLAASVVAQAWRAPAPAPLRAAVFVVATFLATPYALNYDTVSLLFAAVWLWDLGVAGGWRDWERTGLTLAIAAPAFDALIAWSSRLQLEPLFLCALLGLLARRLSAAPAPQIA
jgi:hypothetical protein